MVGAGRINRAPQPRRSIRRDLEAIAPLVRVGEVAAKTQSMRRLEIERRGKHNESFRPGKSFEGDVAQLAYNAAAAVGANQVSAVMHFNSVGPAHINTDRA